MKRKICFFNSGAVHYRMAIYKLLDQRMGVEFYFGDNRKGGNKGIDYTSLEHFKGLLHNIYIGPLYWQRGALSLLRKYSIIFTTGDTYAISTWVVLLLAKLLRKPVFLWTIGAMGDEKWFERLVIRFKAALVTGTLVYGQRAKDYMVKYGANPKKIDLVYNSLDYERQIEVRKDIRPSSVFRDHFNNDNPNLVFIGRLAIRRKLDMLVNAAAILRNRGKEVNVTFIGAGPALDLIKRTTDETAMTERVWLYGPLYDEARIAEFLYNADLVVSPGGMGLAVMHAFTFGCPVITHDNFSNLGPECEAIVPGETGLLFRENDTDDLARAIEEWLDEHKDRDAVRKQCYQIIERDWTPERQYQIIHDFILGKNEE